MAMNRPTEEQIRARAYQICLEHGRQPGHDVDDWLQAEYELMQLPVRKIAELEPPKPKKGKISKASLVNLVHAALVAGGQAAASSQPMM